MNRRLVLTLLVLATIAPAVSHSQVTVRRGTDPGAQTGQESPFASPLIVEAPFPALWDQTTHFTKMQEYFCQGVRIYDITFKAIDKKGDSATLRCHVDLATALGGHAQVDVLLEVVGDDDEILTEASETNIKTREGTRLRRTLKMPVTKELLEQVPPPKLRVTLRAQPR